MARRVVNDRFELSRRLDRGSTSSIFLASDLHNGNVPVALKVANRRSRHWPLFQDHLRQEAAVLGRLAHPGIVNLIPLSSDGIPCARADTLAGGPWYCALEYVGGGSLAGWMRHLRARASMELRLALFRQIATVVAYMHQQGYAHLDLKPEHVLLRDAPGTRLPPPCVLIDFGTATRLSAGSASDAYSVPYAAPEQTRRLSGAAAFDLTKLDVWSLGVCLLELVTPYRPRRWTGRLQPVHAHLVTPLLARSDAPSNVRHLLSAMLDPIPTNRPALVDVLEMMS